ncbi:MAG: PPOX class F420-dependent oxidoreductase [Chloroflexi bacterium]|nr:PPOX class F420-dependent oxidoreductase [Chloroflexota bacterium]
MSRFAALGKARYVSLETYRASGLPVRTPVWIATEEDKLYCWTISDTGKVKRISRNSRVRLAKCSARGHIRGGWADAEARILTSPAELRKQMRRMRAKYGLLFLPFAWWPRLTRTAASVIEFSEAGATT